MSRLISTFSRFVTTSALLVGLAGLSGCFKTTAIIPNQAPAETHTLGPRLSGARLAAGRHRADVRRASGGAHHHRSVDRQRRGAVDHARHLHPDASARDLRAADGRDHALRLLVGAPPVYGGVAGIHRAPMAIASRLPPSRRFCLPSGLVGTVCGCR